MEIENALKLLNSKFLYTPDKHKYFDKWKILTGEETWKGDCEDYSLTLMWLLSDNNLFKFLWNILSFKFLMWHVNYNGGHAVVKINGLYYDNIQKKGMDKETLNSLGYDFKFPMFFPFVFVKLLLSYTIGKLI